MPETDRAPSSISSFLKNKTIRVLLVLVTGLGLLVIVTVLSAPATPDAQRPLATANSRSGQPKFENTVPSVVEIRTFANSFSTQITAQSSRIDELDESLVALKQQLSSLHELNAQLVEVVDILKEDATARIHDPSLVTHQGKKGSNANAPAGQAPVRLRTLQIASEESAGHTRRHLRVPAGTFASCTLLSGIYAPTTGEPLPVLLRINQLAIGPNKSRVPIRGAFLIGKAQGDANSRRAIVQLTALSIVRANGEALEIPVNGYIADGDGVQGAKGEYVYRIGEIAGHASLASGLEGLSETFRTVNTTRLVNPLGGVTDLDTKETEKIVGLSTTSKALSKLSEIFTKRLEEIIPAIHVPNGKAMTAVFINSVTLEGFDLEEINVSTDQSPYSGLDAHR